MNLNVCPDREPLTNYALGHLPEQQLRQITDHLDMCPDCEATVSSLDDATDTLVNELRVPMQPSRVANLAEFEKVLPKLKAIGSDSGEEHKQEPPAGRIREYELIKKIGEGGMGAVYRARHTKLKREVAIKVLPVDKLSRPGAVARFEREMEAVGKLNHQNIVVAHDAGESDGQHFLVMELVDGTDLGVLAKQVGPLPIADACEIVRQAAIGLQHAHEHGMVHRDIKPSNLLLNTQGQVKILDLGLALFHGEVGEELTSTGQVMGTLDYLAPEQAEDTHSVDIRADIYSLGCTLYKLLCRTAPFGTDEYTTPLKKLMAIANQPIPRITERRPDLPEDLVALIDRMLAKKVEDRHSTPIEVANALQPFTVGCDLKQLLAKSAVVSSPTKQSSETTLTSALLGTIDAEHSATAEADSGEPLRRLMLPAVVLFVLAAK